MNSEVYKGNIVSFVRPIKPSPLEELAQLAETGVAAKFFERLIANQKNLGLSAKDLENISFLTPETIARIANGNSLPHKLRSGADLAMQSIASELRRRNRKEDTKEVVDASI